jgi:hypothetical protein
VTSLATYELESAATDRVDWAEANGKTIHLLGALGEYGSVLSELKKSRRDGDRNPRSHGTSDRARPRVATDEACHCGHDKRMSLVRSRAV